MFCPKCGLQNADNTKFCRSCGADLSNVLAVVEGKMPDTPPRLKEYNDLYSSGIRNLILGFGFLLIAFLVLAMPGDTFYWMFLMIPGISLLASGISRIVKAEGMKTNNKIDSARQNSFPATPSKQALPPLQTEYVKPSDLVHRTDDLAGQPFSVTEKTTRQLQMNSEDETIAEK